MLIRRAEIAFGARCVDVRVEGSRITGIEPALAVRDGERVIDARGHALIPGLHDHHLHLYATAAAMASLDCGPPAVGDAGELVRAIADAAGEGVEADRIRGTGYHESVAGTLDRTQLDAWCPQRPLRIQHRSGRLWIFNSVGLARLGFRDAEAANDDPLEREAGRLTGRLYDADPWLRKRIGGQRPELHSLSQRLARWGVTGVTDTGHANDRAVFEALRASVASGELLQDLIVMGDASLDGVPTNDAMTRVRIGAHKFHLHDHALPEFDALCAAIRASHSVGRGAAFHCVTRGELVYAMAALAETGSLDGDRIEHAGLVAPESIAELRRLRVRVVTQPHFIHERGDAYLREVDAGEQRDLYRLRSLLDAGIPLASSSDAPYGDPDPWRSMQAAVSRATRDGAQIGADEALSPEQALGLHLSALADAGGAPRSIEVGARADLCLLDRSWAQARAALSQVKVRLTAVRGMVAWEHTGFL